MKKLKVRQHLLGLTGMVMIVIVLCLQLPTYAKNVEIKETKSAFLVTANELALNEESQDSTRAFSINVAEQIAGQVVPDVQKQSAEAEKAAQEAALRAQQSVVAQTVQQRVVPPVIKSAEEQMASASAGQGIANYAVQFAGWLPYVWAGASLQTGADCCGFTMAVYNACGYSIARTVEGQAVQGYSVSYADAQPGDIVIYGGHVAIYLGNGQIVHSPTPGQTVTITNINMMPVLDIRRMV